MTLTTKWEKELEEYKCTGMNCNHETVETHYIIDKDFIQDLLKDQQAKDIEKLEGMKELHKHNSIPGYIDDLENGCIICVKNQALDQAILTLKGEK